MTYLNENRQTAIDAYADAMAAIERKASSFSEKEAREALAWWDARAKEEHMRFVRREDGAYDLQRK